MTSWKDLKLDDNGRVVSGVYAIHRGRYRLVLDCAPVMTVESFFIDGADVSAKQETFPTENISSGTGHGLPPLSYVEHYAEAAFNTYSRAHSRGTL